MNLYERGEEDDVEKAIPPELLDLWNEVEKEQKRENRESSHAPQRADTTFNDKLWDQQWYMVCKTKHCLL